MFRTLEFLFKFCGSANRLGRRVAFSRGYGFSPLQFAHFIVYLVETTSETSSGALASFHGLLLQHRAGAHSVFVGDFERANFFLRLVQFRVESRQRLAKLSFVHTRRLFFRVYQLFPIFSV